MQAQASRLRLFRVARGHTQLAVSTAIGSSPARYSLLERGLVRPTARERAALASEFGVSEGDLFTADDRPIMGVTALNC